MNEKVDTLRRMGLDWAAEEIEKLEAFIDALDALDTGGILKTAGFNMPTPREFGSRVYKSARAPLLKEIEDLKADNKKLRSGIMMATIGSCTCMTKTPIQKYHKPTCTYRILMNTLYGEEIDGK